MARETGVQSHVKSYQGLKKWYLMPPCLTLSIIRYGSRVNWSNPGKGVVPFLTPWCSRYWKGSLQVALDYDCQTCDNKLSLCSFLCYLNPFPCWKYIPDKLLFKSRSRVISSTRTNPKQYSNILAATFNQLWNPLHKLTSCYTGSHLVLSTFSQFS